MSCLRVHVELDRNFEYIEDPTNHVNVLFVNATYLLYDTCPTTMIIIQVN